MTIQIVQAPPLYLQIYEAIREDILTGAIEADEQIVEAQLAKKLNVSRGPIREAVGKLELEGLLLRKNGTLFVYKTSKEDLKQIYQCRIALESLAVKLLISNLNEEIHQELQELFLQKERFINELGNPDESDDFNRMCTAFHDIILNESKNERLYQQTNQLRNLTRFYKSSKLRDAERRVVIHNQHFEIYNAIKDQDSDRASNLMQEHMEDDLEYLLKNF
ncbi:hypothetical protein SporoP37_12345 [Sporosarcina sp. P37]|uniref:GntR family transcriptional regulator n=1 Tax=unclassified Sporosarcina TaxID=2647733 RepID=UPI0009BE1B87|nr:MULTISPECIES: GntR family transcriptional regulator [unclassified Sporosarcina]ARD48870.1 hypothetical protein SporoP33_11960 [Sporosarcina sp. P33]ARK25367.1 hypothetical protein SporoP37_12345 [Sporosarcina sp. P37]PID19078.1 GntR family transcriptional regulator [Sporosarcina sp. P35]